jgi:hypothetical protein
MIRFVASIQGVEVLDRAFNRVDQEISDFRNFWPGVITTFYDIETQQFHTEGASGASGKWTPLSPAYKLFKEREFPGKTILRREDALYESMTGPDALDSTIISLNEESKRRIVKSIQQRLVEFTRASGFATEERAA